MIKVEYFVIQMSDCIIIKCPDITHILWYLNQISEQILVYIYSIWKTFYEKHIY